MALRLTAAARSLAVRIAIRAGRIGDKTAAEREALMYTAIQVAAFSPENFLKGRQ